MLSGAVVEHDRDLSRQNDDGISRLQNSALSRNSLGGAVPKAVRIDGKRSKPIVREAILIDITKLKSNLEGN